MKLTGDRQHLSPANLLRAGAAELGLSLESGQLDLFAAYEEELVKWNRIVSLVAVKSPFDITIKHFLDSLTALAFLPTGGRFLDIGAGAGFPGLPLKIVNPAIDLYLLESSRKKVSFLKTLIRKLALSDVTVIHERVEKIGEDSFLLASCDVVISRAVFKTPTLLDVGRRFLRPGGLLVAMRGSGEREEMPRMAHLIKSKGFYLDQTKSFRLPVTGEGRSILIYKQLSADE